MIEIHQQLYWERLGLAGALAVTVFVLLGLLLRLRDAPGPRVNIWAMIAFFLVNLADGVNALAYSDMFSAPSAFFRWNDVIIPGFMVSLFIYVRALTDANPALYRRDAVHLIPFGLGLVCLSPTLMLPGDVRRGAVDGAISERYQQLIDIGETAFWVFWIGLLIVYGAL